MIIYRDIMMERICICEFMCLFSKKNIYFKKNCNCVPKYIKIINITCDLCLYKINYLNFFISLDKIFNN